MKKIRDILGITLTNKCNLDCSYCYIQKKGEKTIPIETAKNAIAEAFHTKGHEKNELEIDFVGAEPFCAFETMREICEWTWSQAWQRPYTFFTSTNGTGLTDTIKDWLVQHKEQINVGLSYDGIKPAQDINRSNSYDQLNLDFFINTWPRQWMKMTVSEQSVPFLAESIIKLHETGARVTVNCAFGEPLWSVESFKCFSNQMATLVKYYLQNPELEPVEKLFQIRLESVLYKNVIRKKHCGAGTGYYIIDMKGEKYPCHIISPLVMEDVKLSSSHQQMELLWKDSVFGSPDCSKCILDPVCPICHGISLKNNNNIAARDKNTCIQFKIQVMACCKLTVSKLSMKAEKSKVDLESLRAINTILKAVYNKQFTQIY